MSKLFYYIFSCAVVSLISICSMHSMQDNEQHPGTIPEYYHGIYNDFIGQGSTYPFSAVLFKAKKDDAHFENLCKKTYAGIMHMLKEQEGAYKADPVIMHHAQQALKNCNIKQKVEILQTVKKGNDAAFVNSYAVNIGAFKYRLWTMIIRVNNGQALNDIIGTMYHECGHLYHQDPVHDKSHGTNILHEARADKFGYEHLIKHNMHTIALERILEFAATHDQKFKGPAGFSFYDRAKIGLDEFKNQHINLQELVKNPPADLDPGLKEACLPLLYKYFPEYFQ